MCLHSHSGPVSPVTGENEVSNFNEETGSLDANDNWIVKMPEAGSEWKMATNISLFHPSSSANLASRPIDSGNAKFNYTMGHQEVWNFRLSMEDRGIESKYVQVLCRCQPTLRFRPHKGVTRGQGVRKPTLVLCIRMSQTEHEIVAISRHWGHSLTL